LRCRALNGHGFRSVYLRSKQQAGLFDITEREKNIKGKKRDFQLNGTA
jgi:hypothetical protein